jgi:hypothetical protein
MSDGVVVAFCGFALSIASISFISDDNGHLAELLEPRLRLLLRNQSQLFLLVTFFA